MTTLEKFVSFAEGLPTAKRADVESALMTIMSSFDGESLLSSEQEAENRRRFTMPARQYAKRETVEDILERKLPS